MRLLEEATFLKSERKKSELLKTAFSFVCYCTWGMLFEPLYDHDLSTGYIFKMAYFVFINFFRQKATLTEIKEKQ